MDRFGLTIDSTGNLDKAHSGLLSSIMKNAQRLNSLLSDGHGNENSDVFAKVEFQGGENLLVKHSKDLTIGLRQVV